MLRHWVIFGAVSLATTAYDQRIAIIGRNGIGDEGRHVILVVSDGLRWQEVFSGADSAILSGDPAMLGGSAEWLNRRREFRDRVAAFGTWDTFRDIFNVERSRIHVHTNGAKPHDHLVQAAVMSYLKRAKPRALFVGFAETDDWGHQGRYDRFLDAAHAVDRYIAELWAAVQVDPRYRNRTTIIFTADHGRGRTPADWRNHGDQVPGSGESFIVTIGPETRALGEARSSRNVLGEVAPRTAAAVGLGYSARVPVTAAR